MQHSCSHSNAICKHKCKKRIELRTQLLRTQLQELRHHFPSSPLPFLTTSLRHHFPSSPLPMVPTSLPHHSPSSPLPFLTTSLPHHFPSSPPPFLTTSLRHHFPSSPLPFVTTSLRHHFPSSPLPFVTTPSLSAPFIKINSTASYSFVLYCYVLLLCDLPPVIYHPSSKSIPPLLTLLLCIVILCIVIRSTALHHFKSQNSICP